MDVVETALGSSTRTACLRRLSDETFDLLVIGGGIGAACAAWDAALRGLKVALVERLDFGAATSAHSFRVLHGGIRYLQHLDMVRLRESCRERGSFLRIAPHLMRPMPIAVPTYGLGIQSKWVFATALGVLESLTFDRNSATRDVRRHVPRSYLLSRKELLERFPFVGGAGLSGAGVFYDGQIVNPPRAVLAVLRAAAEAGAAVSNYCEARQFVVRDGRVMGVKLRDLLGRQDLEVRAHMTLNATGPFAPQLAARLGGGQKDALNVPLSRDMAFVIDRPPQVDMAVAVQTRYRDPDAKLSRGNRHLFVAPWRQKYTIIGVNSRVYDTDTFELGVTEPEIEGFVAEINDAAPTMALRREEVKAVNAGLLPFGENEPDRKDLSFGKRSVLVDHARQGGLEGLISAMSIRWTMGRLLGERAVDMAECKLHRAHVASRTASARVWGGDIESVESAARDVRQRLPAAVSDAQAQRLFCHYGSRLGDLLGTDGSPGPAIPGSDCFEAEVLHAVRTEMAATLCDVVLRRTDLGSGECPPTAVVERCAALMAQELGWDPARAQREIAALRASYPFANPNSQLPVTSQ